MFDKKNSLYISILLCTSTSLIHGAAHKHRAVFRTDLTPSAIFKYINIKRIEDDYNERKVHLLSDRGRQKLIKQHENMMATVNELTQVSGRAIMLQRFGTIPSAPLTMPEAICQHVGAVIQPILYEVKQRQGIEPTVLMSEAGKHYFAFRLLRTVMNSGEMIKNYCLVRNQQYITQMPLETDILETRFTPRIDKLRLAAFKAKSPTLTLQQRNPAIEQMWQRVPEPSFDMMLRAVCNLVGISSLFPIPGLVVA